jgi:hypothetical protein
MKNITKNLFYDKKIKYEPTVKNKLKNYIL